MQDESPTGWTIQSRMPILGSEWEPCRMHGETPPEGFTQQQALRIASSLFEMTANVGPEIQWRVLDPQGNEIAQASTRDKEKS